MKKWAKIFESEKYGQILALSQYDDEHELEEIKIKFKFGGLVFSPTFAYESEKKRDELFDHLDLGFIESVAARLIEVRSE